MGQYLSPDDPNAYEHKCAIIIYPDDEAHFYLQAVRGQLSELARPFVWEGDREKTDAIAQIFTATDLLTDDVFFGLDCELLPVITGDETLNINVNCNCGGCSGAPTTLYCMGTDGAPVLTPQIPDDASPPVPDGYTLPLDPAEDTPPADYNDWDEYDAGVCLAANWMWQTARLFASTAETFADVLATLVSILVILVPFLPTTWVAAASGWTLMEAARMLVKIFLSEQATDILNDIIGWLDDEKEDIICFIYGHRYDWRGIPAGLMIKASDYVESSLTLTAEERNAVQNLIANLFAWSIFYSVGVTMAVDITGVEIDEMFNCNNCGTDSGLIFWNIANGAQALPYNIGGTVQYPAFHEVQFGREYWFPSHFGDSNRWWVSLNIGPEEFVSADAQMEFLGYEGTAVPPHPAWLPSSQVKDDDGVATFTGNPGELMPAGTYVGSRVDASVTKAGSSSPLWFKVVFRELT